MWKMNVKNEYDKWIWLMNMINEYEKWKTNMIDEYTARCEEWKWKMYKKNKYEKWIW